MEVVRNVRLWDILIAAKLIDQYKRTEVRVATDANPPDPVLCRASSRREAGAANCVGAIVVRRDLVETKSLCLAVFMLGERRLAYL